MGVPLSLWLGLTISFGLMFGLKSQTWHFPAQPVAAAASAGCNMWPSRSAAAAAHEGAWPGRNYSQLAFQSCLFLKASFNLDFRQEDLVSCLSYPTVYAMLSIFTGRSSTVYSHSHLLAHQSKLDNISARVYSDYYHILQEHHLNLALLCNRVHVRLRILRSNFTPNKGKGRHASGCM